MCFSLPQSKALQVDTSLTLSMTRVLSLREFAKRERANSWQSKGKFAFNFIDCHAVFVKTARNDGGFCHFERSALAQSDQAACKA